MIKLGQVRGEKRSGHSKKGAAGWGRLAACWGKEDGWHVRNMGGCQKKQRCNCLNESDNVKMK